MLTGICLYISVNVCKVYLSAPETPKYSNLSADDQTRYCSSANILLKLNCDTTMIKLVGPVG